MCKVDHSLYIMVILHQTHEAIVHGTHTCAPQMSQRVPWQIGFTMQCPHYCYRGNQALLHNHPILSSFLEGEKKDTGLGGGNRVRTIPKTKEVSFYSSFFLCLTHISLWELSKLSWTEELLHHPPKRTLYLYPSFFSITLDPHLSVMVWQRKSHWHWELFLICLLLKLPHMLASPCIWYLLAAWAWADMWFHSSFLSSEIQFPQDLWINFCVEIISCCVI